MNKEFSNIIVFNNKEIVYIKNKIRKMLEDLEYKECSKDDANIKINIVQDNISKICIISSRYFEFKNLSKNKSVIRKIAKKIASDAMMVTATKNFSIIERYSFNKRIYDYICFGNKDELSSLGYNESYARYMYKDIWKNHFVGKNNINDLDNILSEIETFFENYEIVLEILKLYGIKVELATYSENNDNLSLDVQKEILYFK